MTMTSTTTATGTVGLSVNGTRTPLTGATPHTTLLDWLREQGLTGTKEGCAEGECGACSVLVARPATTRPATTGLATTGPATTRPSEEPDHPTEWVAINACLLPVAALDGQEIVTAEGLGSPRQLHPVQRELADRGGSQCGYCTPGFVCSMAAEYYRPGRGPKDPVDHEEGPNGFDLHALSGNLCRCTGYRPIRDAAYALGTPEHDDPLAERRRCPTPATPHTVLRGDGAALVRPDSLSEVTRLLADRPDAVLLAGSTDIGVELNLRGSRPALLVAIDRLPELRGLQIGQEEIRIGAALTLTEIERGLEGRVPLLSELFAQFASRLIRNAATLGGNLGTASPIGDAAPVLLALQTSLVLTGPQGDRLVPLADYFTGYRETVRAHHELIREVRIPLPLATTTAFHKIAKRRFDDISSVALAFALDLADGQVVRARIGLGGVAATPLRALRTEAALEGMPWTLDTIRTAAAVLGSEGTPMSDHRASDRYRAAMLERSLPKLYAQSGAADQEA